ncbi:MAG TPA: SDR family NAD(P)-dependent oxidoreductase [Solirubrobacterales bacterium]|nr:SDR family NAD(P)-dependent oxidoreductase [Solirubrobacterales bacterium]
MELAGTRILLSGATGGLGRAIAVQLAGQGASLVLSSRKGEELERLARSLPGGADRHLAAVADLAEPGAAGELIARAGDLDGLVANAALPATGRLENFSSEEVQRAVRVNFESPILMARALGPRLAGKGRGHLVFIASLAGKVGSPRSSLYNATKFGVRGFVFGLREDLHPHGVGVSVVSPGFVREAGMFADSGAKPPPGLGTTTPKKVAGAVVRAIREDRNEITVAPLRQRLVTEIGYRHPEFAAWIQRRGGAERIADELASGQADKR